VELFSVIYAFPDVDGVMKEMHRVPKTNTIVSIQSQWPEKKLLDALTADGLFHLREKTKRRYKFENQPIP
jgi:hypothetical protein